MVRALADARVSKKENEMAAKKKTKARKTTNHVEDKNASDVILGQAMMYGAAFLKLVSDVMESIERRHQELKALREREIEALEEQVGHFKIMADYAIWLQDHRNDVKAG